MTRIMVTPDNLEKIRGTLPIDQRDDLKIGCIVTHWDPGEVEINGPDGQWNGEGITTTIWPDEDRGAWCYGGNSFWGDVNGTVLNGDDGDLFDLMTGEKMTK
jgi:hypothetical protein